MPPADPYQLAMSLDLDSTRQHALETISPIQWPTDRQTKPAITPAAQAVPASELEEEAN